MSELNQDDVSLWGINYLCTKCGWEGTSENTDRVPDPRGTKVWLVCPRCRTPEHLEESK